MSHTKHYTWMNLTNLQLHLMLDDVKYAIVRAMSNNKLIKNWWVCPRLNFESEHEYECEYYYVFMTFTKPLLVSWWTGKMKSKGAYTTKLLCLINFYLSSMTTWIPTTLAFESDDERNSRDYFLHTLSIFIDFILYRCW